MTVRKGISRYLRVVILLLIVLVLPVGIFVTTRGLIDRGEEERALPGDLLLSSVELPDGASEAHQLVIPTGAALSFTASSGSAASCFVLVGPGGEPIEGERFVAVADETVDPLTEGLGVATDPVDFVIDLRTVDLGDQAVAFSDSSGRERASGVIWRESYATAGCFVAGPPSTELIALAELQQAKLSQLAG